jgi:hypothetical protein
VGLVVVGGEAPSPARDLARMQAFVTEAGSARMTATSVSEQRDGTNELGSIYKDTSRMTGSIVLPDRSQWLEEDGTSAYETVVVPGGVYFRGADSREELAGEQWVYEEAPKDDAAPQLHPDMMRAGAVAGAMGAPDLIDLLEAASAPTRVGPHTIKAAIDVAKLHWFEATPDDADVKPPTMSVELTSTSEGRLDRMVLRMEGTGFGFDDEEEGHFTDTTDMRFTDWGASITIAAPDPATVDPTPGVDEDDIAAFTAMPLYGLRRLPTGYELGMATVLTSEKDADVENGDCPEVDLSYGNPAEQEAAEAAMASASEEEMDAFEWPATIEVVLTPAACESYEMLEGGDPITLGGRRGTILRATATDEDYATSIEFVVGTTRVLLQSDGPEAAVVAAASDLVPLDLTTQPVHHEPPPA